MSEAKHTPEWEMKLFDDGDFIIAEGPVDELDSRIVAARLAYSDPEYGKQIASLLFASPDLLAACKAARNYFENMAEWSDIDGTDLESVKNQLTAAIEKAEGNG